MILEFFSISYTAPSTAPTNVRYTMDSEDVYTFNWDPIPCGERNGVVKSYKYKLTGPGGSSNILSDGSAVTTSVTISNAIGLLNGEFSFQVAAVTLSGGPFGTVEFTVESGETISDCFKTAVNDQCIRCNKKIRIKIFV